MSRQLESSDVARINRLAPGEELRIDSWTARVLNAARVLSKLSRGAFDVVDPYRGASSSHFTVRRARAGSAHIFRKKRALQISLDGIAKGFAVDQAVRALRKHGARAAMVNAGGDLRCFGERAWHVSIRRPDSEQAQSAVSLHLTNAALATAGRFASGRHRRARTSAAESWTVATNTCIKADALTKVVGHRDFDDVRALQKLRASAWHLRCRADAVEWQPIG